MMEFSNIIKSDIIKDDQNGFWEEVTDIISSIPKKAILILSSSYKEESAEDVQLQKMLHACKLEREQYNVIQLKDGQKAAWHKIKEQMGATTILLIGVHPLQLGISAIFRLNEVNHFNDCTFVPTLSLSELDKNPEAKKQLWNNGLKPLFIG